MAIVGFAFANGMTYGRGNHWQYLLHGLHEADPAFLAGDWFATQTVAHHGPFNWIVRAAAWSGRPELVLGLLNGIAASAFAVAIYAAMARFSRNPLIPFGSVLLLASQMGIDAPGHSNILLDHFVPSVFSGVAMLIAIVCLLYGRLGPGGLMAGIGGAMHANYLLLGGCVWGIVVMMSPARQRRHRAVCLFAPLVVAALPHVSFFRSIGGDAELLAASRPVFFDVYAPQHYRPSTWRIDVWTDFGLWLIAGAVTAWQLRAKWTADARRIVAALLAVIGLAIAFTVVVPIDAVVAAYPWRMAPFLVLAAFAAVSIWLDWIDDRPAWQIGLTAPLVGVTLACSRIGPHVAVLWLGLATVAFGAARRHALVPDIARRAARPLMLAVLILGGLWGVRHGLWRRDAFTARTPIAERALFDWCRAYTPVGTVFAIPPDLAAFRLRTGRAVVVDWKCMPLRPGDQLEWLARHERQSGRSVRCVADACGGYATLDAARAAVLAESYAVSYIAIRRADHRGDLSGLLCAYRSDEFEVYRIPPATASRSSRRSDLPRFSAATSRS